MGYYGVFIFSDPENKKTWEIEFNNYFNSCMVALMIVAAHRKSVCDAHVMNQWSAFIRLSNRNDLIEFQIAPTFPSTGIFCSADP